MLLGGALVGQDRAGGKAGRPGGAAEDDVDSVEVDDDAAAVGLGIILRGTEWREVRCGGVRWGAVRCGIPW